jgi:hypothetical protein
LLRTLCGGVFAVVVDEDYRELAQVVLLEEAGYGLADGGSFVAGWHYGDYGWPRGGRLMTCEIVMKRAQAPKHSACYR